MPRHAVLLSAGQGRRLLPHTADRPKCLLALHGRSVIERQIDTLLGAGIERITVVAGYGVGQVQRLLEQRYGTGAIALVFNPFFEVADNLASCWLARAQMTEPFLLMNGDTLFERAVLARLLGAAAHPITLAVDRKSAYDADDMKVGLRGERLHRVGKALPPSQVAGESIGLLRFDARGARLFREALERAMRRPQSLRRWYLSVIDQLARSTGEVFVQSIEGLGWCELDFPEDLAAAEAAVRAWDRAAATAHG